MPATRNVEMEADDYRFLDPWWLLLPDGGAAVLAVAGSGGRSTLLRRLCTHYRSRQRRVLWTQSSAQPAPADFQPLRHDDAAAIEEALESTGAAFVAGEQVGRLFGGLAPEEIEALRARHRPDIVLVDAHARCERPLRRDAVAPRWPAPTHLALLVAPLSCVGRVFGPDAIAGIDAIERLPDGSPRRIATADIAESFLHPAHGLLAQLTPGSTALPFLTGFGAYRDMDGMFELVRRLWQAPGVRAVCLAELLGDERRDAADLRDMPRSSDAASALSGERIYAVYPASLDAG